MATNEVVEPNPCVELNGLTLMEFPDTKELGEDWKMDKPLKELPIQKFIECIKELNLPYFIIYASNPKSKESNNIRGLYIIKEFNKNNIKCDFYPFNKNHTSYLRKGLSLSDRSIDLDGIKTMRFNSAECKKNISFNPACLKRIQREENIYINVYVAINKFKLDVMKNTDYNSYIGMKYFNRFTLRQIMVEEPPLDVDIYNYVCIEGEPLKNYTYITGLYFKLLKIKKHNNEFYNKLMNDKNTNIKLFIIMIDCILNNLFLELNDYMTELEPARQINSPSHIEYYNERKNRLFNYLLKLKAMGIDTFLFLDWMIEIRGYKREKINKDFREQYPDHLTVSDFVLKIINEYRALIDAYHNKIFKLITNDILGR